MTDGERNCMKEKQAKEKKKGRWKARKIREMESRAGAGKERKSKQIEKGNLVKDAEEEFTS